MLIEQTMEKMNAMKLSGMADGLRLQLGSAQHAKLAFDDRLGLLVDAGVAGITVLLGFIVGAAATPCATASIRSAYSWTCPLFSPRANSASA